MGIYKRRHQHRTKDQVLAEPKPVLNPNREHCDKLSPLEILALKITDKVGSPSFFLLIFTWTVVWVGYNMVAPHIGLKAFDPFPAFVAYLLISNVIQILLMPLIMVGQNLQSRHSELRAESDFEVNVRAEHEITEILLRLEKHQEMMEQILKRLDAKA